MTKNNSSTHSNGSCESDSYLREMVTTRVNIQTLTESLRCCREERTLLEYQLKDYMGNRRNMDMQMEKLANRNEVLETLFVVTTRLLAIASREDVFIAIRDIVANVIGSEEMVLWELDPQTKSLTALTTCGVDVNETPQIVRACQKVICQVLVDNEPYFATEEPANPVCCIPVRSQNGIIGALTIHSMLPQKPHLEPSDSEVLSLLECQIGCLLEKYPKLSQGGAA